MAAVPRTCGSSDKSGEISVVGSTAASGDTDSPRSDTADHMLVAMISGDRIQEINPGADTDLRYSGNM